jgi:hypothetical protein
MTIIKFFYYFIRIELFDDEGFAFGLFLMKLFEALSVLV